MASLKMRLNGNCRLFDVAEVRLPALVERCWNADDDGVRFLELGKIRGRAKVPGIDELLDFRLRDMLDVGFAGIEHRHFVRIRIETRDFMPRFRETQRQRKSNVSTADDGHLQLGALEEFRFPVYWHELRRSPRYFFGDQAGHSADLVKTLQYSRFQANTKCGNSTCDRLFKSGCGSMRYAGKWN